MTKQQKIRRAARIVAKGYIKTLEEGLVPARLSAQIEWGKYDILDNVGDGRLNMSDTLEAVRVEAHRMIRDELQTRPDMAKRLIEGRAKIEAEQEEKEQERERRDNAPLARHLAKMKESRRDGDVNQVGPDKIAELFDERYADSLGYGYEASMSPGDIALELDVSTQKVVSIVKRNPKTFGYRPGYHKTCQGCLASREAAGYYPAEVRYVLGSCK